MKLMFISDIHGSYYYLNKALEAYYNEKPDKLILLGDLLYHGPRNDLPKEYAPKKVIPVLNGLKNMIIAVRGNCDAEVDQMVLDFPMMADYATIDVDGHHFFLSHGHLFNEENLPNLNEGDIFVYGHIHRPVAKCENGIYIINPSSEREIGTEQLFGRIEKLFNETEYISFMLFDYNLLMNSVR